MFFIQKGNEIINEMKDSKFKKKYITSEGAIKLKKELTFLWSTERPKIVDAVHEAAKNGDRSENGDYIYGKRKLREIDRRLKYITNQLSVVNIVRDKPNNVDCIYFSAFVELENLNNKKKFVCRLVGVDETNIEENWINVDSPLGKSLIGRSCSDVVKIKTKIAETEYKVINFWY
tara:strand:- start:103 stop:627 length:525 start_codon:yes stop_codon:yes gene_type:complete